MTYMDNPLPTHHKRRTLAVHATDSASTTTITVTRYRLDNPGRSQCWAYNYVVEGDPMTFQYGPGIVSLRAMLHRRFPVAKIVETWHTR